MERWKDIPDYEGRYQVSDLGRVRSLDRTVKFPTRWGGTMTRQLKGRVLAQTPDKDGYPRVGLHAAPAPMRLMPVHRLVALVFVPNPGELPEVDHKDNDRTNARAKNLQWTTTQGNTAFKVARGRQPQGSAHPRAELTETAVLDIRARVAQKVPFTVLAAEYGVSDVAVRNAALGLTWRHV